MRRSIGIKLAQASILGFLAVASTMVSASAATLIVPTGSSGGATFTPPSTVTLSQTIGFSVAGSGFIDVKGFGAYSGLSSITEKLFKVGSSTPLSVYHDTTPASYVNYFGGLYAGSYEAVVTGIMTGVSGSLSTNVAAVPLPGAALLFGSAVAGLAAVRSRRSKSSVA